MRMRKGRGRGRGRNKVGTGMKETRNLSSQPGQGRDPPTPIQSSSCPGGQAGGPCRFGCPGLPLAHPDTELRSPKSSRMAPNQPGPLPEQPQPAAHSPGRGKRAPTAPQPTSSYQTLPPPPAQSHPRGRAPLPGGRCHPRASLAGARGAGTPFSRDLLSPAAVIAAVFIQTRRGCQRKTSKSNFPGILLGVIVLIINPDA